MAHAQPESARSRRTCCLKQVALLYGRKEAIRAWIHVNARGVARACGEDFMAGAIGIDVGPRDPSAHLHRHWTWSQSSDTSSRPWRQRSPRESSDLGRSLSSPPTLRPRPRSWPSCRTCSAVERLSRRRRDSLSTRRVRRADPASRGASCDLRTCRLCSRPAGSRPRPEQRYLRAPARRWGQES